MKSEKIKPSFDADRQILGKVYPLRTPFNVIIDSSERCNFRCSYCFRSSENRDVWGYAQDNELMPWEIFTRTVEQIKEFPDEVKQISLSHHGEPLCNPRLPHMAKYIKEQGIRSRISMHTNASLLNDEIVDMLAESEIDKIVVSLQGLSAGKYREICKADVDFSALVRNLGRLHEKKVTTQLFVKVMDASLEEGEAQLFYDMFAPIADRVFIEKEVQIWKDLETKDGNMIYNKYGTDFPRQQCCPLIFHTIVVIPNGDVYPCTQILRKDKLGNVKEDTLKNFWCSSARMELLKRQCLLENPDICRDCFIGQNSIYAREDMIDEYREEILERLVRG